ncbi:MAG: PH domain-containing protein [Actinomycetota bacterium]|nr:PH domain-containing protein [Actinomycetota bacterium]
MAEDLRPDIAAAKSRMRVKMGGGREIKRLPDHLWEGETVERMTTGVYGNGNGLIVLTDRRLLFVRDGVMSKRSEDFPLDKVSSVQWGSGLMLGAITIFASGNKTEIKNVNKDDGKEIVDLVRARISAPSAAPSAAAGAGVAQPDIIGQLRQLGELKEAGVLSPEEFEAKKAELLRRL